MFIKLVHQAGEKLVSILLFSDVELPVPHFKDLQQTRVRACSEPGNVTKNTVHLWLLSGTFQKFSGT